MCQASRRARASIRPWLKPTSAILEVISKTTMMTMTMKCSTPVSGQPNQQPNLCLLQEHRAYPPSQHQQRRQRPMVFKRAGHLARQWNYLNRQHPLKKEFHLFMARFLTSGKWQCGSKAPPKFRDRLDVVLDIQVKALVAWELADAAITRASIWIIAILTRLRTRPSHFHATAR